MREFDPKLDQAARIAWMYHVEGAKQDAIARHVGLSRQGVQRALALARAEGLIKVRLDHPVAECMELATGLRERWGLDYCEIAPVMPGADALRALSVVAGARLEVFLREEQPLTIGLGTGRTLRAVIDEAAHMDGRHHRLVARVGVISPDGSTNPFDTLTWLADKTGARSFQLPAPILADSPEDREHVAIQRLYRLAIDLALTADVTFIGVGSMDDQAPLRLEGCITMDELRELRRCGAIGELTGWILGADGEPLDHPVNHRVTSVPLRRHPRRPVIGVAGGPTKVDGLRAALNGGWLSGLITDTAAARALLD